MSVVFEPDAEIYLRGGDRLRLVHIKKSHDGKHKYEAVFKSDNGRERTVKFGAVGYEDFTMHHDLKRKEAYLERHQSRETWSRPDTPGALSRWILWNKPTLKESVADFKRRFYLHEK
jgi:hypothetical protein